MEKMEKLGGRRVKKKHYLLIIVGLFIVNLITISVILLKPQWLLNKGESVATIGNDSISRQEWLNELEAKYGETTLRELVDQKVVQQMAKKYDISIKEEEINREMTVLKTTSYGLEQSNSEEKLRQQIKHNILLEEILTKDAIVPEEEMEKYFQKNKNLYEIPTSYQVSQIIVKTKSDADQTINELKQGSSFSVLAMERSIEEFSAIQGGNIGYVNEDDDRISSDSMASIKKLKRGSWTQPIKVKDGYALFLLHDQIPAKKYSYKEVKNQIRRQIALEQMDIPKSADVFWKETKVDWFYGNKD
jgi:foldase protein PrsA